MILGSSLTKGLKEVVGKFLLSQFVPTYFFRIVHVLRKELKLKQGGLVWH